jgi:UV DNA damage repair endonuclease
MRIGFACKKIDHPGQVNGIGAKDDCKRFNTMGTTVAWLNRQSRDVAEQKLWDIMIHNIESIRLLVEWVGSQNENLRMVRLGSDVLNMFTEPTWRGFYERSDVRDYCQRHFRVVGDLARARDVRLSMHPGQFLVLGSDNPDIVNRSIEEFEYHATVASWLGFAQRFQDFKINVHISGRAGPEGVRQSYSRLSPEARNCITIENEEITWGLGSCLELADIIPIVLDIHHHYIHTGEYIETTDQRVARVIDSWRGVRPVAHYSQSPEHLLVNHPRDQLPNLKALMESGYKKQKLRAHSDFYWNTAVNDWALTFLDHFHIMAESKGKNLASFELYRYWCQKQNQPAELLAA